MLNLPLSITDKLKNITDTLTSDTSAVSQFLRPSTAVDTLAKVPSAIQQTRETIGNIPGWKQTREFLKPEAEKATGLTTSKNQERQDSVKEIIDPLNITGLTNFRLSGPITINGEPQPAPKHVPTKWGKSIKDAYKKFDFPKGLLEAVLMKESQMGTRTDTSNIAELKDSAIRALKDNDIEFDLSTEAGVIDAMAKYLDLRMNLHDDSGRVYKRMKDPVDIYMNRYYANKNAKFDKQIFEHYLKAYQNL